MSETGKIYLKSLSLINFKNYTEAGLSFSPEINCFTGENGSGKTNLLDAIHYLSFCKSFLNPVDSQNIHQDAPFFIIQGVFDKNGDEDEVYCGLKRNQKKQFKRNKKEYSRLSEHIGIYPLVIISPADNLLISEGSEMRRKFLDSVIAQYDKKYLEELVNYNRALMQRNALLKKIADSGRFDPESLGIWDEHLVQYGMYIHALRKQFLDSFVPLVQHYYQIISNEKERIEIQYLSQLNEGNFLEKLRAAVKKDIAYEYTSAGIHKDDLELLLNGNALKKFGSQGQQKSFIVALKLAEFEMISRIKNKVPLLLLDDIYDKLDDKRINRLMQIISGGLFGQIFITDTQKERISGHFNDPLKKIKYFNMNAGVITEEKA